MRARGPGGRAPFATFVTGALVPLLGIAIATACGGGGSRLAGGSGGGSASVGHAAGTGGGQGTGGTRGSGTGGGQGTGGTDTRPACNQGMGPMCDPYGMSMPQGALADAAYWSVMSQLAAPYYRPAPQSVATLAANPAACTACDAAVAHGLKLVLVVANGGPPASLTAFEATVGAAIDRYAGSIAALVVEDEPTTAASWSGTPAQFLAELAAGCHAAHARGVRCAGGGIDSTTMLLVTAGYYEGVGFGSEALRILQAAGNNPDVPAVTDDQEVQALLASRAGAITGAKQILAGLPGADVDYATFHWYESDENTFDETIALLRQLSGCNALASDRLGGRSPGAAEVAFKLNDAQEMGLRLAVWDSTAAGDAASFADTGGTLTMNGLAMAAATRTADCGM